MPMLPGSNPDQQRPVAAPAQRPARSSGAGLQPASEHRQTYSRSTEPMLPAPVAADHSSQILEDLLYGAGKQRVPFDPSAVGNAREEITKLLTPAGTTDPSLLAAERTGGRGANPAAVLGAREISREQDLEQARATLDSALRAQRAKAIGANTVAPQGAGNIRKRTDEMTDAEYNALDPKQKAAIDFNTMLVDAVRRDRKLQDEYDPTKADQRYYDAAVSNMFGDTQPDALQYAPETLAVLKQIGYNDPQADINDFLSLKATIKTSDLKDLATGAVVPTENARVADSMPTPEADRTELMARLASSTQRMEAELAKGTDLLTKFPSVIDAAYVDRANMLEPIGAVQRSQLPSMGMIGYGAAFDDNGERTIDGYFQTAFEALAAKKNQGDKDAILSSVNAKLSPSEFDAFMAYADARSANSSRYDLPLGETDKVDYSKADRFRKMLNLDQQQGGGY